MPINFKKLLAHNLRQPLNKRISANELQEKVAFAHVRGNLVALRAKIETEIAPTLAKSRELDEAIEALA